MSNFNLSALYPSALCTYLRRWAGRSFGKRGPCIYREVLTDLLLVRLSDHRLFLSLLGSSNRQDSLGSHAFPSLSLRYRAPVRTSRSSDSQESCPKMGSSHSR